MSTDPGRFCKYLAVTSRDADWGVYGTTVGYTKMPTAPRYPPEPDMHPPKYLFKWEMGRIFDEYALIYITRGGGAFRTEGDRSWRVGPGTILMLFPYVWHWYEPDKDTGWDEYWVGMKGDYVAQLAERGFFSPENPVMEIGLHDSVLELYREMVDVARLEAPGHQQVLGSLITRLMACIHGLTLDHGKESANERIVERAKFLLADNVASHLDIGWLSKSLGLGYSRFRQIFKTSTGLSPYQYFLEQKISRAKELLEQGHLTVKEIAHMLSFDDPYYFSHLFKKKTGQPPSAWR